MRHRRTSVVGDERGGGYSIWGVLFLLDAGDGDGCSGWDGPRCRQPWCDGCGWWPWPPPAAGVCGREDIPCGCGRSPRWLLQTEVAIAPPMEAIADTMRHHDVRLLWQDFCAIRISNKTIQTPHRPEKWSWVGCRRRVVVICRRRVVVIPQCHGVVLIEQV